MNNQTSRNSIILKNLNSPYIEQAIFILKKGNDDSDFGDDIVDEAQKIIDNFIKKRKRSVSLKNKLKTLLVIVPFIGAAAAVLMIIM